ncbi:Flp pilus assembly protein TadG [Roseivivax lentus]|uniref:Flp pilus assembly protein TadG n=1 Tax=Roseivivax lentus TaxID=633194 RepID=A0A1N7PZS2_9RHOB|nr:TadE/TadG family type IV pilus assembly protein [Roseivivax lentus]SIT16133.1 Flp pilus assembly protein TadG [Roseivivax lentus]
MLTSIKRHLSRFRDENTGSISVEAAIVFPALIILFFATWVWFDVSRQQAVNQKANYTIGDAISRETDPLNNAYIDSSYSLLQHLTRSNAAGTDLRISVVEYNSAGAGSYDLLWSEARGVYPPLVNGDLVGMEFRLPIMSNGDQVVLVETWEDYVPAASVGLSAFEIQTYSFTRPRFAPQIHFEGKTFNANNGWGNGDQDAAGNSLCNNNAENAEWNLADSTTHEECADNVDGKENQGGGTSKKSSGA